MLNYGVRICVSRLNDNRTVTRSERTYSCENLDTTITEADKESPSVVVWRKLALDEK